MFLLINIDMSKLLFKTKHVYCITSVSEPVVQRHLNLLKGCRMGRSDKVSLWYLSLLIITRFRFFFFFFFFLILE